mgnify:CR=1 FL=1
MRLYVRSWRRIFLTAVLCTGGAASAWGWAGAQHIQISKAAGRDVPEEMAAFRDFSRPMVLPAIYPDLWKETDLDEPPRHYFEPDRLPPDLDIRALSPIQSVAIQQINARPDEIGIAPWVICDLQAKMTSAMRTNDWLWAARCGATMAHYVADIHMPLHCTRNFNGQETWQVGIHERIETDMTKAFFSPDLIHPAPAAYLADPFHEVMGWIVNSTNLVPDLLKADIIAKRSANGRIDTESYYRKLWELTESIIVRQIEDAVSHLASLWYTAWVDAGRPPIPEPFNELPTNSVFSEVGIDPATEGGPVGASRSRDNKTYDTIIWSVMGLIAIVVIASSLHRGALEKKSKR